MIVRVFPSKLSGSIVSPRSKSSMQRACAAALLHKGITEIINPGFSNDDRAAIDTIQKLGAEVDESGDRLIIKSRGINPESSAIHCGESGLGIRMFTPIAALSSRELEISGTGSLVSRPMHFFDEIFPKLGIRIQSNSGRLPLKIRGPLKPSDIEVDGSLSSQFLTGLLMAFSAAGADDVTITVNNLTSKPYIDLTLAVMQEFGMKMPSVDNYERFYFPPGAGGSSAEPVRYAVEGDWSGAAFLLVGGAVAGDIELTGLQLHSTQADKAIMPALEKAGAKIETGPDVIKVSTGNLQGFEFDATECPDLFPPLVALAANCKGDTVIKGAKRLTFKESDRAATLQEEFGKLGIRVDLDGDVMTVHGGTPIRSAEVHSHHDHRIAMANAIAALNADGPVIIHVAEAVRKSYPSFYTDLTLLGVRLDNQEEIKENASIS